MHYNMGWNVNYDGTTFWASVCYNLWIWHNKETYDENYSRQSNTMNQIFGKIQDYDQEKLSTIATSTKHKKFIFIM